MQRNKIKVLPDFIANKIAAGEVVQRPESVVKELLENAIDASAMNIELVIRRAGKVLLQVVDDGVGMDENDLILSVKRHATSKINDFDDLDCLGTFGFRGEALSAIAAVSILEIQTKRKEDDLGTKLRISEESEIEIKKGAYPKGTTVSVKNIFYNTPARRKFLKSNSTELKHIIDTFNRTALSAPDVSFKLINDDDIIFDYKKGSFEERVKSVVADNITDAVLEVKEITDYITLRGYLARPTYLKNSRGEQYLFINGRYVVNKSINHAVYSAYESLLEKGNYPFFVLFLELDQSKIDINVHPSKLEVKFDNEKEIYSFVNAVIRKTLGSFDLIPNIQFADSGATEKLSNNYYNQIDKNDFSDRPSYNQSFDRKEDKSNQDMFGEGDIDLLFSNINKEIKQTVKSELSEDHPFAMNTIDDHSGLQNKAYVSSVSNSSSFIVSLHNKYILSPIKSGLMIIDQHVAHERILYEKALNSLSADMPFSQQLLFAQTLELDPAEYELIQKLEVHLTKLGFEIKFFGKNTVVIDGVPNEVKVGLEVQTLKGILNEYFKNEREKGLEEKDNIAKSYSCKTAIKAGEKLSEKEMRNLVDQLFATSNPYVCPHGRPIVVKIPLLELDKRFGRT